MNAFFQNKSWFQVAGRGSSLAVQLLGLSALTAEGLGSIPGRGSKFLQTMRNSQKKKIGREFVSSQQWENWEQNGRVYPRTLRHKENRLSSKTWPNLPHRLWACPALRTSLPWPHHSRLPVVSWEDPTPAKSPSKCQHVGCNDYFPPVNISWWAKALFLAKA